jgi:hypothetical protein
MSHIFHGSPDNTDGLGTKVYDMLAEVISKYIVSAVTLFSKGFFIALGVCTAVKIYLSF